MNEVAAKVLSFNKQNYTFNSASNRYENASCGYIEQNYNVFSADGTQIGQYYPPLMAAPNVSWVLPALLITAGFIYYFRHDIKKIIK